MPEFKDATGQSWSVDFDGLLLAELRDKASVDIVQEGLLAMEEREDLLTKAMLVICREQITQRGLTDRQFARLIVGSSADSAIQATRSAAELFFRPSRWSEIQSRSEQRKDLDRQFRDIKPMLDKLNSPEMPQAMRDAVMTAIASKLEAATSSASSAENQSASGLDLNRLNVAGALLDSSAFTPVA